MRPGRLSAPGRLVTRKKGKSVVPPDPGGDDHAIQDQNGVTIRDQNNNPLQDQNAS